MMRKIGFGMRFSALVIDVSIVIFIVFGLYYAFGKKLYYTIGVMKRPAASSSSSVSAILSKYYVGGQQAANNANSTANSNNSAQQNQTSANTQNNNSQQTAPQTPRQQTTRYTLPTTEPDNERGAAAPPVVTDRQKQIDKAASKKPRGYIHNSKDFVKIFFFSIIAILYFLFEGLKGTTPGKLILRLKIFTPEQENPTLKQLVLRFAYKIGIPSFIIFIYSITKVNFFWTLGMIMFFLVVVGCFFVFSDSMQALHDRLTNTAVFSLYLKEEDSVAVNEKVSA